MTLESPTRSSPHHVADGVKRAGHQHRPRAPPAPPRAPRRSRAPASRRRGPADAMDRSASAGASRSQPRLAAVGATVRTPRSITRSSCTSISGHSLSPRIETSAWSGRGGASASSAATSARMPSGLWATSNSHLPAPVQPPGNPARSRTRARSPPGPGRQGGGSAIRTPCATAAFRRWCGPARAERPGPLVVRRAAPARRPGPPDRPRATARCAARRSTSTSSGSALADDERRARLGDPGLLAARSSPACRPDTSCDRARSWSPRSPAGAPRWCCPAARRARPRPRRSRRPAPRSRRRRCAVVASKKVALALQNQRPEPLGPHRHRGLARSGPRRPGCARGTNQVRRGVEADPPARLAQRRRHQRRDAALAVGAADVDRRHDLVRIAQRLEQGARRGEPELDRGGPGEEEVERLVVGQRHPAAPRNTGAPPARLRMGRRSRL